jgi:hypothetical protein
MFDSSSAGQHREDQPREDQRRRGFFGWSRTSKIVSGIIGALLVGSVSYAVTLWVVGLNGGSSGQAQSATVSNLTIAAIATPSPTNLLFPGGTGDVVAKITNPNGFPVTITAVNLPASTTFAMGYSDSTLATLKTGCAVATSTVGWSFATAVVGSAHTLTAPITVAANGNLTITFTNAATMDITAPAACENTFLSMPSLTGVVASGGAATTTVATTDSWTS